MIGTYFLTLAIGLGFTGLSPLPEREPGDGPALSSTLVPSDPIFSALLIDGSKVLGQIRKLSEADGLTLVTENGEERSIPVNRLVKLVREGTPPPGIHEGGDIVLFPDGDRLVRCKVGEAGELNLTAHSSTVENLSIPLDAILGLIFDANSDSGATDALMARVRTEPRETELLWLANGDKLPGLFSGLDDKNLTFQPETGKVQLPRPGLSLGFPQGQVVYRRPNGPYFEFRLSDGSRLGLTGVRIERGQVNATTRFQGLIKFPIGDLDQVHLINSSVVYLSDREASGAIYESYIGPSRPYRRNATVSGDVLRLGGRTFDHGLGTQSRTLLVYKLEPGVKRFQSLVGVDDRAGPLGNVVFKVQTGDKKTLFETGPLVAGEAPKFVDVDLAGVTFLILSTEFGDRGDVQDHADWAEARLIR
jgi:hypothetical protein